MGYTIYKWVIPWVILWLYYSYTMVYQWLYYLLMGYKLVILWYTNSVPPLHIHHPVHCQRPRRLEAWMRHQEPTSKGKGRGWNGLDHTSYDLSMNETHTYIYIYIFEWDLTGEIQTNPHSENLTKQKAGFVSKTCMWTRDRRDPLVNSIKYIAWSCKTSPLL